MNIDAIITLIVVIVAMVLFFTEFFSLDVTALGIMVVLVVSGVLTPHEGVKGFANPATITIGALFIVSEALIRTGLLQNLGPLFARLLERGYVSVMSVMGILVGAVSAFVNNTPVVATFIPIVSTGSVDSGQPPSRFLIPLSFAAIFGGTCTLIGTSTNLLISGIATDSGLEGFSMFLLTPLGLVFAAVGMVYLIIFGPILIPDRESGPEFRKMEKISNFETEVEIVAEPEEKKRKILDLFDDEEVEVLRLRRGDQIIEKPEGQRSLSKGDILHVKGDMGRIEDLLKSEDLRISESEDGKGFPGETTRLIQIVLLPNSTLAGHRLSEVRFLERYQAEILAIRSRGTERFSDLDKIVLHSGDILLLQTTEEGLRRLYNAPPMASTPFLPLHEQELRKINVRKVIVALAVLVSIIGLASFQILPIMVASLAGVLVLTSTGVITIKEAYDAVDWKVIILIAGALSLGTAMESSGIANSLGTFLAHYVGDSWGPVAVISALYLATSIFTELMSNNAAAAVLAPIAISVAQTMEVDPTPLLLAIAFAGSASFMTPVGYQTNTMVYSAGNYRFSDFTRIGLPLNLIFWILASFLIPRFYPL